MPYLPGPYTSSNTDLPNDAAFQAIGTLLNKAAGGASLSPVEQSDLINAMTAVVIKRLTQEWSENPQGRNPDGWGVTKPDQSPAVRPPQGHWWDVHSQVGHHHSVEGASPTQSGPSGGQPKAGWGCLYPSYK